MGSTCAKPETSAASHEPQPRSPLEAPVSSASSSPNGGSLRTPRGQRFKSVVSLDTDAIGTKHPASPPAPASPTRARQSRDSNPLGTGSNRTTDSSSTDDDDETRRTSRDLHLGHSPHVKFASRERTLVELSPVHSATTSTCSSGHQSMTEAEILELSAAGGGAAMQRRVERFREQYRSAQQQERVAVGRSSRLRRTVEGEDEDHGALGDGCTQQI